MKTDLTFKLNKILFSKVIWSSTFNTVTYKYELILPTAWAWYYYYVSGTFGSQ